MNALLNSNSIPWLVLLAISGVLISLQGQFDWLIDIPRSWVIPIAGWIDALMTWIVSTFQRLFRAVSWLLEWPLKGIRATLIGFPWFGTVCLFSLIAWQGGGRGLALFTFLALMYIVIVGYWTESMNTLSLVVMCIPLAVGSGFVLGLWGYRSKRADAVIQPVLDFMQTVPAFAYLIPILLLFGFGPVVGLIASAIFATPPMVRNTILGFREISPQIIESGVMSGCTSRQQFWWVMVPAALPQMLVGINQTTMASLSMVIIAAIIGGFEDIGWEVLSTMRKAQFGQSVLSGLVIVVLAMVLDRITRAYAARQLPTASHVGLPGPVFQLALLGVATVPIVLGSIVPLFWTWPEPWMFYPAEAMNQALTYIITDYGWFMGSIKNAIVFFGMLPMKIGLAKAVAPFTWGFSMTPAMKIGYWLFVAVAAGGVLFLRNWKVSVAIVIVSTILFHGLTTLAWPPVVAAITLLAFQVGSRELALFSLCSLLFLLFTGMWKPAMLSIYLCGAAVTVCIFLGAAIGIWAASSEAVSSFIRPINDTLQTLPQFVLLIPALMLFQVGEFSALLAIVAYAIVPMIRYTEQGLRNIPRCLIDAGISSGCTNWQMFWQVRLPQAMPQMLLGINQTTLYALGMLVIAALVGTTGLGQQIYIALGKADAGSGIVAGLGMALIAMMSDRILRAIIHRT